MGALISVCCPDFMYPEVGFLDPMVVLSLIFFRNLHTIFFSGRIAYVPINGTQQVI